MEILIGFILFAVFALIWFGIERFTKFTHEDIFWGLVLGVLVILVAYLLGTAIRYGVAVA